MAESRYTGGASLVVASTVAILFGLPTIRAGGSVLFGDEAARAGAGAYVPSIVWFNLFGIATAKFLPAAGGS